MTLAQEIATEINLTTIRATGITVTSAVIQVPGIGTGAAYADGDAVGTMFEIENAVRPGPKSGVLHSAHFIDRDDEGIAMDIVLFNAPFTATADNAAFTVSDIDFQNYVTTLKFTTFSNFGANQVSDLTGVGAAFNCYRGTSLWGQCVTRGAPNIAADNEPRVFFCFLQD